MRLKQILTAAIGILLILLCLTYVKFQKDNRAEAEVFAVEDTLCVLSSYEIREYQDVLTELGGAYSRIEGNPKVKMEFIDSEDFKKDICLRMDRDDKVDMIICDSLVMPGLIDMNVMADISSWLTRERRDRFRYPGMWQMAMEDGKYYGLPFTSNPYVLFYNRDILEGRGIETPRTWDGLMDACKGTESLGINCFGFGARRTEETAAIYNHLLYACGGNYYTVDSEGGVRALELLWTLKRRGYISKQTINSTAEDAARSFAERKTALMAGEIGMTTLIDRLAPDLNYGVTEMPGDVKHTLILSGENIGVMRNADSRAYDFLEFLYREENQKLLCGAMNTFPVVYGVDEPREEFRQLDQSFQESGAMLPAHASWFELSTIITDSVTRILEDKSVSVPDEAYDLQDRVRVAIMSE